MSKRERHSERQRKSRGGRRSPRQRWQIPVPTAEQQALHDELQQPVVPPVRAEIADLQDALNIACQQRDDALRELSDRANITIAFERLGKALGSVDELVRRLRELQINLASAAANWTAKTQEPLKQL